jgi:hypothetical protein
MSDFPRSVALQAVTPGVPQAGSSNISGTGLAGILGSDKFLIGISTADLSLTRQSAGVLQVGDGAANANGTLAVTQLKVGDGSAIAPAIVRSAYPGTGWWFGAYATLFTANYATTFSILTDTAYFLTSGGIKWGNPEAASGDLSLFRLSAGVLQVGDGGVNANGTLKAATAILPAVPAFVSGDKYLVIDASGNIHKSAVGPGS